MNQRAGREPGRRRDAPSRSIPAAFDKGGYRMLTAAPDLPARIRELVFAPRDR